MTEVEKFQGKFIEKEREKKKKMKEAQALKKIADA